VLALLRSVASPVLLEEGIACKLHLLPLCNLQVREKALKALKDRLIERANIIQVRGSGWTADNGALFLLCLRVQQFGFMKKSFIVCNSSLLLN